jgi:uncharacterized protein (DUF2141 family)
LALSRLLLLPLLIFALSCANIKQPTGGEKDQVPPLMIKSIPEERSINFSGDRVTLFFDEQIETKNLFNELIISPDDNIQFKELPSKKSITIRFKDTLRSNTTYNINFGNGVVDITEKNPCLNASLAFSTGPDIDTAFIKGIAIDMFTQKPLKDVIAVLHANNDTIDVLKHKPSYIARTNDKGVFQINNLPQTEFQLFAIQDKNGNLLYNYNDEKIAKYPFPVMPAFNDTVYKLFLSPQDNRALRVTSIKSQYNFSSVSLNKGLYDYSIEPDSFFIYPSQKQRVLNIYHPFTIQDSLAISLHLSDSNNIRLDTTIYLKSYVEGDTVEPEFSIEILPKPGDVLNIPDTVFINSNFKIKKIEIDTILSIRNITDTSINSLFINLLNEKSSYIVLNRNKTKSIVIRLKKGLILSEKNDSLRSLSISYNIPDIEKFGQIDGSLVSEYEHIIIQLISLKNEVVEQQVVKPGDFSFNLVKPGNYKLRAINDLNNNHMWDAGNYVIGIPPEEVKILEEEILLKANWIVQDKVIEF